MNRPLTPHFGFCICTECDDCGGTGRQVDAWHDRYCFGCLTKDDNGSCHDWESKDRRDE